MPCAVAGNLYDGRRGFTHQVKGSVFRQIVIGRIRRLCGYIVGADQISVLIRGADQCRQVVGTVGFGHIVIVVGGGAGIFVRIVFGENHIWATVGCGGAVGSEFQILRRHKVFALVDHCRRVLRAVGTQDIAGGGFFHRIGDLGAVIQCFGIGQGSAQISCLGGAVVVQLKM